MKELNIGKNITVSFAIPHKIKIILRLYFLFHFWMNLDIKMYMLPPLVSKSWIPISNNNEEKCEGVQGCLPRKDPASSSDLGMF